MPSTTRRDFLRVTSLAAVSSAFIGLRQYATAAPGRRPDMATTQGYGRLIPDPDGIFDLPRGFSYKIISERGERMDDGLRVPGAHDGMAAFPGPDDDHCLLVRNHEVNVGNPSQGPFGDENEQAANFDEAQVYDRGVDGKAGGLGGTSTLLYNLREQKLVGHHMSLLGTIRNCAGGPMPWNSWLTCEETVLRTSDGFQRDHGWVFEVPATAEAKLAAPKPIKAMGRYNHEAVAIDPQSGVLYLTEDRSDGPLYRFIPKEKGNVQAGGRLEALAIMGRPRADTRNWPDLTPPFPHQEPQRVQWIDLADLDITAPNDDLRYQGFAKGAARFARGEGIWFGEGEVFICCTNGGPRELGQVFRYVPSPVEGTPEERRRPGQLELFVESTDAALLDSCDNITVAPWGDLIICEDNGEKSRLVGVTPEGRIYHLGAIRYDSELAGATFSPDGSTLFVNAQWNPGRTLAITGPWETRA